MAVKLGLAEIAPEFIKDMKRFDADKDGDISFEEFLTYVRAAFQKLKKTVTQGKPRSSFFRHAHNMHRL